MLHHSLIRANIAALYEFVDSNFINNKRPSVPGGAWPMESLRKKSLADLQQIWVLLVKERNMLASTKEHYLRHQEELGAMPASSRLKMVKESMLNIKAVVKERDSKTVTHATETFKELVRKKVFRYPPGPPPAPELHNPCTTIKVCLDKYVDPGRLRELFGYYNIFESHKGIVRVKIDLSDECLQRKCLAEQEWQQYQTKYSDTSEYRKWEVMGSSVHDYTALELAPGIWFPENVQDMEDGEKASPRGETSGDLSNDTMWAIHKSTRSTFVASQLPVPAPKQASDISKDPSNRFQYKRCSTLAKTVIQLGYFPNITLTPPHERRACDLKRPIHPDEIESLWEAFITYGNRNALEYAKSLNITTIDGARVLGLEGVAQEPELDAEGDAVYQEAVRREMAQEETQHKWPHVPKWKYQYDLFTKKNIAEIVQYNYSNVVDYVDREVLLTGKSVWECPIDIDPTCGGIKSVPAHAEKPKRTLTLSISDVGVTDI